MTWDRLGEPIAPRNGAAVLRAAPRPWELTDVHEAPAPMNARALTAAETLETVREQGRKCTPEEADYRHQLLVPEDDDSPRCAHCVFVGPVEPGARRRCRVVAAAIPGDGLCDFFLPTAADGPAGQSAVEPLDPVTERSRASEPAVRTAAEPPSPVTLVLGPDVVALGERLVGLVSQALALLVAMEQRGTGLERVVAQATAALTAIETALDEAATALTRLGRPRTVLKQIERDGRQNISRIIETHRTEDEGA